MLEGLITLLETEPGSVRMEELFKSGKKAVP
jgi:hypothetical protein